MQEFTMKRIVIGFAALLLVTACNQASEPAEISGTTSEALPAPTSVSPSATPSELLWEPGNAETLNFKPSYAASFRNDGPTVQFSWADGTVTYGTATPEQAAETVWKAMADTTNPMYGQRPPFSIYIENGDLLFTIGPKCIIYLSEYGHSKNPAFWDALKASEPGCRQGPEHRWE